MTNFYKTFCLFSFPRSQNFKWKWSNKKRQKSEAALNRHSPIAQLVERRTVEKLIALGPWFKSGSADGMKSSVKTVSELD